MSEQTVYYNGDILTLVSPLWAQALLVQDGKIAYVGSEVEAFRRTNQHAKRVDLQGKTLMPAFMDAHSHLLSYAKALQSISLQDATSEAEIARRLSAFAKDHPLANHEWITGFGYDPQKLSEHRAPTLAALDRAVPDHPVLVTHQSGHMGVANSAALSLLGIT
ncbi:MAG: amidohydrolase family protein, partial [Clostridia bacterium]